MEVGVAESALAGQVRPLGRSAVLSVLTRPTQFFARIEEYRHPNTIRLLITLVGAVQGVGLLNETTVSLYGSFGAALVFVTAVGAVGCHLLAWILGYFMSWVSLAMGVSASRLTLAKVWVCAQVPTVIIGLPLMGLFFLAATAGLSATDVAVLLDVGLAAWSLYLLVLGVRATTGLSWLRSVLVVGAVLVPRLVLGALLGRGA